MGYTLKHEPGLSLVTHWVPEDGHTLSLDCWCHPRVENEPGHLTRISHSRTEATPYRATRTS